ncbi:MAG: methyltransferase domain-containing protein [Rhodococcus sp.]|uniref:methyltransferase domain-containing protein n=1 Tax=Rhodococcus yananensis TaxID=2879464 RepID=UPI0016A46685|nr:methyltransferase domain-containing protein [Rhodococcus yananensis]NLE82028.1 methyltransferase domain-containing protein [Rhodococcus sp. (in: high G+C Gram-positive bacteria)]
MTFDDESVRATGIGELLISSRSFDEYRAMFNLTDGDLAVQILDCPGGAAGFASEVNSRGGDVTACDVAYFGRSADDLAAIAETETDRGNRYVRTHAEQYEWRFFTGPDEHQRVRAQAAQQFAAHLRQHPHRYVAGRLPSLPFPDTSFDLVLSSHLLFSYSDRLDYSFHVSAIGELMRVARGEVRIFPLVAVGSDERYPRLDQLLVDLHTRNIVGRIVKVDYEFQRGGDHMLVCSHAQSAARK